MIAPDWGGLFFDAFSSRELVAHPASSAGQALPEKAMWRLIFGG
jgi:hypothetical protein